MRVAPTALPDVVLFDTPVHRDARGWFVEAWHAEKLRACGLDAAFVQDNFSRSARGVLRGMHYQTDRPQGKLVRVIEGSVFDVAVDLRRSSPTFGRWAGAALSAENARAMWIPPGFAHGFYVTSEHASVLYKCTEHYAPMNEHTLSWNDASVGVEWPLQGADGPLLSARDRTAAVLSQVPTFP